MDRGELSRLFQIFDKNGDGKITRNELREFFNSVGILIPEKEINEMIAKMDVNGDVFMDIDEFGSLSVLASMDLKQGKTLEDCKKMISKVDVDGDGMVNFKEFKQMMRGGGFAALSSS
ncbi:hypothetical protein Bca101_057599 [Brassica carinata]